MGYQVVYKKAKPIIIDGEEFPSITCAARTLQVDSAILYEALASGKFRGKNIRYKNSWDIPVSIRELRPQAVKPIEKPVNFKSNDAMLAAFSKANQEQQKENKMTEQVIANHKPMGKKPDAIEIDGKIFNSMIDAAAYYNVSVATIATTLRNNKSRIYKGMTIKYADEVKEAEVRAKLGTDKGNISPKRGKPITIVHKDTLKRYSFKSYAAASKFIGVDSSTVQSAVKAGRTHVKEYLLSNAIVESEPIKAVELQVEQPVITPKAIVKEPETISGIQVAKNILKEKIMDYIKSDNFTVAKELMTVVEQIKE